jgi:hypothetical protein
MEYKIIKRKSLRTQSLNTPKSHYHTIKIILQKNRNSNSSFSIFLFSHFSTLLFFSLARNQTKTHTRTYKTSGAHLLEWGWNSYHVNKAENRWWMCKDEGWFWYRVSFHLVENFKGSLDDKRYKISISVNDMNK